MLFLVRPPEAPCGGPRPVPVALCDGARHLRLALVNIERFHAVALQVLAEWAELGVVETLESLRTGLQAMSNQPGDAGAQQRVSEARQRLQALASAPSEGWPSSDKQVVEELRLDNTLGGELFRRVESIMSRNEMTPSVALSEITPIHEDIVKSKERLSGVVEGLDFFDIPAETPRGHAEVVFSIPRAAVHDDLRELGEEFEQLWRLVAPLQELTTGGRSGVPVNSISSSDFGVVIAAAPVWAFGLAKAVNEILTVYKNILAIRQARRDLRESGVPAEALVGIEAHANQMMGDSNEQLAAQLVDELPAATGLDAGRINELRVELTLSLNGLANRLDSGYEIDVRAPEPSPVDESDTGEDDGSATADSAQREFQRQIRALSPELRAKRLDGESILELPEAPPADAAGA